MKIFAQRDGTQECEEACEWIRRGADVNVKAEQRQSNAVCMHSGVGLAFNGIDLCCGHTRLAGS